MLDPRGARWYIDRVRVLGIDPGTRRVGVACADDDASFASPRPTIEHQSVAATAASIVRVARDEEASTVVVGLPLGLDGREGSSSRHARAIASAIEDAAASTGIPLRVELWDERLTSQAAHRALDAGAWSSRDRRGQVDRIAAVLLLEGFLDAQRARRARRDEDGGDPDAMEAAWPEPARPGPGRSALGRGDRRDRAAKTRR